MKLFEDAFRMLGELFKTKFNLMSLSFYLNDHRKIPLPHLLPFERVCVCVCVWGGGVCAFETRL